MKELTQKIFSSTSLLVITGLALIGSISSELFNVSALLLLLISFSVAIFLLAFQFKSKIRLFLISIAVFVLFHLIIFPSLYVLILNNNTESIAFDSQVQSIEKKNSLTKLDSDYIPNQRAKTIEVLDSLLIENNSKLDSTLSYFNNRNILTLSNYLAYSHSRLIPMDRNNHVFRDYLVICNRNGEHIMTLANDTLGFYTSQLTVRDFIMISKNNENDQIKNYENEVDNIRSEKGFWTFNRILAYSVNIFNADIIKPKSGLANIVFAIHRFVVFGIILTIIVGLLPAFLARDKK